MAVILHQSQLLSAEQWLGRSVMVPLVMASRLCILEVRGPHLAPQTQPCKNLIGKGMVEAELREMMERRI